MLIDDKDWDDYLPSTADELQHFSIPNFSLDDVKKHFDNAAKNAQKTANDASKNISKALNDTGKNVSKAMDDAGKALNNAKEGLGGALEREWKKHKWIARKRDKDGKWIYDYGDGFPGENKKKKKGIGLTRDTRELETRVHENRDDVLSNFFRTFGLGKKSDIDDVQKKSLGEKFLNGLGDLAMSTLGSGSNAAEARRRLGDSLIEAGRFSKHLFDKATSRVDSRTGLALKKDKTSKADDLKATNPGYTSPDGSGKMNCYACTVAYDLRRRGYEVTATEDSNGANFATIKSFYKNAKPKSVIATDNDSYNKNYTDTNGQYHNKALTDDVTNEMKSEPDNSRGYMVFTWNGGGGGHAVAYERENGKTYIYDAQSGQKLKLEEYCDAASTCTYFRTDNIDVNYDNVKKVLN